MVKGESTQFRTDLKFVVLGMNGKYYTVKHAAIRKKCKKKIGSRFQYMAVFLVQLATLCIRHVDVNDVLYGFAMSDLAFIIVFLDNG